MAKEVKAPKETQSKLDGPAVRQPDAEVRRTGESGTQAKSSTKKRLNVAVVSEQLLCADLFDVILGGCGTHSAGRCAGTDRRHRERNRREACANIGRCYGPARPGHL